MSGPESVTAGLGAVERILIIRTSALGDVIHALPSLAALRAHFPRAEIAWLVEPLGASILEGHPALDRLVVVHRKRWARELRSPARWLRVLGEILGTVRELRRLRFDLVIDFQCNYRSALATLLSGGRRRVGFAREDCREWAGALFTDIKAPPTPPLDNKVLKNLALVRAVGWEGEVPEPTLAVAADDVEWARRTVAALPGSGPVVAVHPGVSAFGALKRWPVEHFRALCGLLESELGARVLLTWGPGEEGLVREIGRGTPAPPTPKLLRLAALLSACDLFIACDTGNLHLAAVGGTPFIGLYGPKNPLVYGPRGRGRIVRSGVPCSPCALRRCEHSICMTALLPERVLEAARELLGDRRRRAATAGAVTG